MNELMPATSRSWEPKEAAHRDAQRQLVQDPQPARSRAEIGQVPRRPLRATGQVARVAGARDDGDVLAEPDRLVGHDVLVELARKLAHVLPGAWARIELHAVERAARPQWADDLGRRDLVIVGRIRVGGRLEAGHDPGVAPEMDQQADRLARIADLVGRAMERLLDGVVGDRAVGVAAAVTTHRVSPALRIGAAVGDRVFAVVGGIGEVIELNALATAGPILNQVEHDLDRRANARRVEILRRKGSGVPDRIAAVPRSAGRPGRRCNERDKGQGNDKQAAASDARRCHDDGTLPNSRTWGVTYAPSTGDTARVTTRPSKSIRAAIDVGSNSTHLLVARIKRPTAGARALGTLNSIDDRSDLLGLGDVVHAKGQIPVETLQLVIDSLLA